MSEVSRRALLAGATSAAGLATVAEAAERPAGSHADLGEFLERSVAAFREHVGGRPQAYLDLWSKSDEVAVLGAGGGHVEGYAGVRDHLLAASSTLDWGELSVRRLLVSESGDLAFSVMLETMRHRNGERDGRTLRATQGYRREGGRWRIVLRHANPMTPQDEGHEAELLAKGADLARVAR